MDSRLAITARTIGAHMIELVDTEAVGECRRAQTPSTAPPPGALQMQMQIPDPDPATIKEVKIKKKH